jgi:hypothetical protein
MIARALCAASLPAGLAVVQPAAAQAVATDAVTSATEPLDGATLDALRAFYKQVIDAEDRQDLAAIKALVWQSPSALFVAKTATPAEGNWAGFWGADVVVAHIGDLFRAGSFHIEPDYDGEKIVGLSRNVAETYVPVKIRVAMPGRRPFRHHSS